MNTITKAPNVALQKTRAAQVITEHADRIGLPEPAQVTICGTERVAFGFDTLAQLTDWALWMEAPITERRLTNGLGMIHKARGLALDEPIEVWAITYLPKEADR